MVSKLSFLGRVRVAPASCPAIHAFLVLAALLVVPWVMLRGSLALGKDSSQHPRQTGRFIRLTLPITGQTFDRTRRIVRRAIDKAKKEDARLVLVFEFDVPKGQKNFGRGSEFGAAHDLANFLSSEELNAVRTVAYCRSRSRDMPCWWPSPARRS